MELVLTLSREELVTALDAVLPLRILLGKIEDGDGRAWFQIDALETRHYATGLGLRVTCAARIHYPLPILPDYFTVKHVSLHMVPAIIAGDDGGAILAFTLSVTEFDIQAVPAFIDRVVAGKINDALRAQATTIAWDFRSLLGRIIPLPERIELLRSLVLSAPRGEVTVAEHGIVVRLRTDIGFLHDVDRAGDAGAV